MKALALINAASGVVLKATEDVLRDRLAEELSKAGWNAEFESGDCETLLKTLKTARSYDAVVCAGGDGTQAAIAHAMIGSDAALLPLPCGTVNLFCRDLGLPMEIPAALAAGLAAAPGMIDVGRIESEEFGERGFLNNVVFGAYADLAEARESIREASSIADVGSAVAQAVDILTHAEPTCYQVDMDGAETMFRTNTLVVSNNPFTNSQDFIPRRERLDNGSLAVYLVQAEGGAGFTARLLDFLTKAEDIAEKVPVASCKRCVIGVAGGKTLYAIDGEPQEAASPVTMSIVPKALKVLAPAFASAARPAAA